MVDTLRRLVGVAAFLFSPGLLLLAANLLALHRTRRAGFRARITPPFRRPGHVFDPRLRSFVGGGRVGHRGATWPFVTLNLDGEWARLKMPYQEVWMHRSEVASVAHVQTAFNHSVLFQAYDGRFDGVVFFTFSDAPMRNAAYFGWPTSEA